MLSDGSQPGPGHGERAGIVAYEGEKERKERDCSAIKR